jgi:hypothetical protein
MALAYCMPNGVIRLGWHMPAGAQLIIQHGDLFTLSAALTRHAKVSDDKETYLLPIAAGETQAAAIAKFRDRIKNQISLAAARGKEGL